VKHGHNYKHDTHTDASDYTLVRFSYVVVVVYWPLLRFQLNKFFHVL